MTKQQPASLPMRSDGTTAPRPPQGNPAPVPANPQLPNRGGDPGSPQGSPSGSLPIRTGRA